MLKIIKIILLLHVVSIVGSVQASSIDRSDGMAQARITLIIDDVGNKPSDAGVFMLPRQVTLSILPFTPYAKEYALRAEFEQRDVMLHMPMESISGKRLGMGAMTASMNTAQIHSALTNALQNIPNAIGLNNHMGSKLTQLAVPMNTTMDYLLANNLFFVDSRTTAQSRAELIARQHGVLTAKRHVFLDHHIAKDAIRYQFSRLVRLAKKNGKALGIAHPHPETLEVLKEELAHMSRHQVTLVSISDYFGVSQLASIKEETNPQSLLQEE